MNESVIVVKMQLAQSSSSIKERSDMTATSYETVKSVYLNFTPDHYKPMEDNLALGLESFANQFVKLKK